MLKVSWKWKKQRGNWLAQLDFRITIEESEDLLLNPNLSFVGEYELPGKIFLVRGYDRVGSDNESAICKTINKLSYNVNEHFYFEKVWHIRPSLSQTVCENECGQCQAFLPCRAVPDYTDYESVFVQAAQDLCAAWNRGVQDALDSLAYESPEAFIKSKKE